MQNDKERKNFQWRSNSAKNAKRAERFATPQANPVTSNNLEDFGFVSKGDERLISHQNQERYHKQVTQRYLTFCGSSGGAESLEIEFAALAVTPLNRPSPSKNHIYNDARNGELTSILLSMRKLREGITASRRADTFAVDVFKQHIRAAILVQQFESYHAALRYLLYEIHPQRPLSPQDLQEFAVYYVLHLAAKLEDYADAFAVRAEFNVTDQRALQAVRAMIHGNYWSYRAARKRVDQYMGRLMDFAEERVRKQMLKCIGATYFTIEVGYLELVTGMSWERLVAECGVGWELDPATRTVTVKRPKLKSAPKPSGWVWDSK